MKKITSLLWALFLSTAMFAQLPDGSVAPNFTATDINGNSWNLYALLDQGKTVILEFSATWCGPCWNYHNTNTLQNFYEQHGPQGDNSAMVLFIEADLTTSLNCLTGDAACSGGTQGDWTAGKTHPFINTTDADLVADYAINYFPTIYMVCSDKLVKEVGQLMLDSLEAKVATCPTVFGSTRLLTGQIVNDENANCLAESGENPLANWGVTATGQNNAVHSTVSNASGTYRLWVDSLNAPFTLSFTPPNALWEACPPPPPIYPDASDTILIDHAAAPLISCPQLTTTIGTALLRRCFENGFHVEVCNNGTATAVDAYVDVVLPVPEFSAATSSTLPYTTIAPGIYHFELGDIAMGACVSLQLYAPISCDSAVIGQTLCFEAHAYPDSLCIPTNSAWTGATVSVEATCNNNEPQFSIRNIGTSPMLQPLNFIVIEDDVMRSEGVFLLDAGESLPINVQNNGSTWRVEALQVPNHPVAGNPSAALEGCTVLNNFTTGFVVAYPVYDPSPAHDVECMTVIGSWDPNDKTGFPLGITDEHLVSRGTDLDYLIRFQNTGNDTAFTVVVRDTLSAYLDASSIRLGASSHAYEYSIEKGNILIFNFKDIKLVDSFANEPASHGFLRFKISQKPDLTDGTTLNNRAAIYFDFNPPVITNTTVHKIGEVPHVTLSNYTLHQGTQLSVYPNPLDGSMQLHTTTEMPLGSTWTLYDFTGKLIGTGNLDGNTASVGHYLQQEGLYRIEFWKKDGLPLGGATIQR